MSEYDIVSALQGMEEELILSMKRNLQRHLQEESDEGFDWTQWQAEKLNGIARYRAQNAEIIGKYTSTIPDMIDEMIRKSYESGKNEEEIRILKALKNGYTASTGTVGEIGTEFFAVNERKLNALVDATKGEMRKATSSILRYQEDIYRQTIFRSAAQFNMGGKTLYQAVDVAAHDFLSAGISNIRYKDGRQVNIASYVEMALRTANLRANMQGEAAKRDEWGISTVKMSDHGSACPKCVEWQGKVYYDDMYSSIEVPKDGKYPLLSTAVSGGALHPNCKNGLHTWFEGINKPPKEMTPDEIKEANRRYALEQEQRYCERNVRKYKRLKLGALDPEDAVKYAAKEKEWRDRMKKLIQDNPDVLRMDYARLKLYDVDTPPKKAASVPNPKPKKPVGGSSTGGKAVEIDVKAPKDNGGTGETYREEKIPGKALTSGVDGGIIKEQERMKSSSDYAVPKNLTKTREFRRKFDSMDPDKSIQREYYQTARSMLQHRSGTNGEDLYFYNTRLKKWYKSTSGVEAGTPAYTEEILHGLQESQKGDIVSFHNHPLGMPPSAADLNAALRNGYQKGYTIGHNGVIFEYTAPKYPIDESIYNSRISKYKSLGQTEFDAQHNALIDLSELYGFSIKEVK